MASDVPDAEALLQHMSDRNHTTPTCAALRDPVMVPEALPPIDALRELTEHATGCTGCQNFLTLYLGFRGIQPTDACLYFREPFMTGEAGSRSDLQALMNHAQACLSCTIEQVIHRVVDCDEAL